MIAAITDTHTAIWYLFSDERLGRAASAFIDARIAVGDHICISAISLAEMVYLIETCGTFHGRTFPIYRTAL